MVSLPSTLERIRTRLILLALFLMPWQTRWIFGTDTLSGGISEFGVLSFFVVEGLIVLAFVLQPFIEHHRDFDGAVTLGWVMMLAMLASVFSASNPHLAMMAWLHVLGAYVLFLNLLNRHVKPKEALFAFTLGLVAPALLGVFQAVTGSSPASTLLGLASHDAMTAGASVIETFSMRWLRAYGSFQHPNVFGGYLAVGLFAVFLFLRWDVSKKARMGAYAVGALLTATLVLTYSRSAWIAFVLSSVLAGWLLFLHHRVELRRVIPLGLIILFVMGFTATLFSNPYVVALEETHPGREVYAYQPVHNLYLLMLSELGVIGTLFVLLWMVLIDRYIFANLPRVGAVGALAIGSALFIIGFFDHYLWSLWPGLALVAFVLAMTLRLSEPGVEKE
ncbi:MAG: O-antigen polymerase [Candidatus Giovannonibacteria bacterium GW2011_GWA2_53_7]|uniref:O-antigen polymerase n=1 Tax=Candidatus Giovannonibacteria bacterium GW2011_GWA2_53_7 TaxID=1618650 RepID=A0A0G1Y115_9BACT|nr:MAG: O-antigen polymerase [Candidatus Giovannonibacteria bacterium GW2011_GWA2_53_7]